MAHIDTNLILDFLYSRFNTNIDMYEYDIHLKDKYVKFKNK